MGDAGRPYARFQRALKTGNLNIIRAAAAELPRVDLGDALVVCVAIRQHEPHRYERACLKWLARYCTERATSVEDVGVAVDAFDLMPDDPESALASLQRLCR